MNLRYCAICRRSFGALEECPACRVPLKALPDDYPVSGTVIDGLFELLAPVAAGGMSRIYRAQSLRQAIPVAVKVLDPRLGVQPYTVERFYREARVSLLLEHGNVVQVHTFGLTAEGHHTVVMEFLGGESLGSALRRLGHMPWKRVVHVAIELCDALGHAHGRRVIHRDLKPDNIQLFGDVGANEIVKLLDFGVAYVAADHKFSAPAPGSIGVSGTPAYMSPEQIRGLPLDGRSDIYSMGVLLFEMLSGRRPFLGDDPVLVCRKQLYTRPPNLEDFLPADHDVPRELSSIVRQLMAKSRQSRLPGVGALLERLLALLPKEEWPARLRRPRTGDPPRRSLPAPSLHGLPTTDLLATAPRVTVALLFAEIEDPTGSSGQVRTVGELLGSWRAMVEEAGGLVQQPEPRAVRAFYGLFRPAADTPEAEAHLAARHALVLRDMVARFSERHELTLTMRSGLLLKTLHEDPGDTDSSMLKDQDADVAYYLSKRAREGGLVLEAGAAEALKDISQLEPAGRVAVPGVPEEVAGWHLLTLAR